MNIHLYQLLPARDKSKILAAVSQLSAMNPPPSTEKMKQVLEATGHLDLAMDCYAAQLMGVDWTK